MMLGLTPFTISSYIASNIRVKFENEDIDDKLNSVHCFINGCISSHSLTQKKDKSIPESTSEKVIDQSRVLVINKYCSHRRIICGVTYNLYKFSCKIC